MTVPLVPGLAGEGPGRAGRAGRRRKLSEGQLAQVEAALEAGPKANGFPTEMWTLARGWCRAPTGPRPHGHGHHAATDRMMFG